MYCIDLLKKTGIMTIPGSGFGQRSGTYHVRITNLQHPTSDFVNTMQRFKDFNEWYQDKYS